MLYAIIEDEKVEAKPDTNGICPLCGAAVFSKCGEIKIWHWSHFKDVRCDNWYEPETEWHKNWKLIFGKENCEIVISKDRIRHFADVRTKENVIIEFQNSPIQKSIIRSRETFYGERMIWVINGKHFIDNFVYSLNNISRELAEDEEYNRLHNPLYRPAYKNNKEKYYNFKWNRPRKSWTEVQRVVFIDFGDDSLFWINEGMGTRYGSGKKISKEKFVKKYSGDLNLLQTIIDSSNI